MTKKAVSWTFIRLDSRTYALAQWDKRQVAYRLIDGEWVKAKEIADVVCNGAIMFGQSAEDLPPLPEP